MFLESVGILATFKRNSLYTTGPCRAGYDVFLSLPMVLAIPFFVLRKMRGECHREGSGEKGEEEEEDEVAI